MSWHVRYIDIGLNREMLSTEFETQEEALQDAWDLAEEGQEILAIEGPDEVPMTAEEVDAWFETRRLREEDLDQNE